ncbi:acyl-CoA dehydrogenase family protein [Corynebacterium aquatimens]|uniref:Long-chain-acyl-CoA dehydrogenase n=1 Tax=Corynebacterium aquatimens TaxID=1190508 RepID=A0A931E1H3_9CORY|nr:acyl-CoA dehydrogenase family protein [Corynebacterium aquatimens]MBG6122152.1 long-chain-acyl-CoA dehydrogenase [Corynebacterium aquatimens]WJY65307.1 Acyl-CoA dehydrogenase [Corynebacterium aquatimens]
MAGQYDLYAPRDIFDEDHIEFRNLTRDFLDKHVEGHVLEWEQNKWVPEEVIREAGEQGIFSVLVDENYGGAGLTDFRFRQIAQEEFSRYGADSLAGIISVHADIIIPYYEHLGTEEQKQKWVPGLATGELISAVAMTEPGAGSDLRGMKTTAVRDGDDWVLNGSKTFISNGMRCDLVIVAARTPDENHPQGGGITLFVVEDGMEGFSRGRKLEKIGSHAADTAELSFENVRVPDANRLGEVHKGLHSLMSHLPLERLSIAIGACAGARAALNWTIEYVTQRKAFGQPIAAFQNTQFEIAEMITKLEVSQAYVDAAVLKYNAGELTAVDAAKAKWWATDIQKDIVDRCLQLFGGYGYMMEYPIGRSYINSRVQTIYGGTNEIMKLIIGREVFGG